MRIRINFRIIVHILFFSSLGFTAFLFLANRNGPLFFLAAVALLGLFGFLIVFYYYAIERPLLQIQRALKNEDGSLLHRLHNSKSRFGLLADLVARSFDQKVQLNAEINERKKTEIRLAEREKQYRDLFETAPDAIVCTDRDGNVVLHNQQALSLFGYEAAESITGKKIHDFLADPSDIEPQDVFSPSSDDRTIHDFECVLKKITGEQFAAEIRLVPLHPSGIPSTMLMYIKNITAQKNAETDKKRLEEQFRVAYKMEAIGQIAGGIAHEYNNILGAISGYADLIKNRYHEDERLAKYAHIILSAARRASELTKKLLIFARKNKLNMTVFDAREALVEIIGLLEHTLEKTITISSTESSGPFHIFGDVSQFQNAIMNLALNARDAMPNGGKLAFRSAITTIDSLFSHHKNFVVTPGTYVAVSVTDTGCGMNNETLAHLFEPFFTTKDIGQGTGLGLASVYGIMKSHSGFVDVQSTANEGTVFTLYFPYVKNVPPDPYKRSMRSSQKKAHILLVDDETFLQDAVKEMLAWLGHTVTTSSNGEEALSLFSMKPDGFDLVILDMKMPGISGLECYQQMRKIKPDVCVLISTGYSLEEEQQTIIKSGICGIIEKPYVSAQLAQAVNDVLQERHTQQT